jgi:hypothetical protein
MEKHTLRFVGLASAGFGLLIALATPSSAQRVDPARARIDDQSKRETQLRVNGATPESGSDPHLRAMMEQIQEDFTQILTLHNRIARSTAVDEKLDYKFVSDATAEIKKRASRLQTTLALKPEDAQQNQQKPAALEEGQMKDGLITLCKQIKSFVTNPVIESPGKVDPDQTARARRDLETIIELSGTIRKSAERLSKSPR